MGGNLRMSLAGTPRPNMSSLSLGPSSPSFPQEAAPTAQILSLESHKRNNIAYIEDDVLVTSAGNNVVFISLSDMSYKYMAGLDGGGIGAIAVHPR